MHTCTIKVTFAINSILKLSHKKLSSTKLEKNRNSKVIVKFMKQFCNTQRLIAWHVKNLELRGKPGYEFSPVGKPQSTPGFKWEPHDGHMRFGCTLVCMTNGDNIKSLFSSFRFFFFFFFFYLAECLFCYLQELLISLAAEQKSKSESKQLVMSFQWPISMKLRAKTSRLRQCQPSEFISEGEVCSGKAQQRRHRSCWALRQEPSPY